MLAASLVSSCAQKKILTINEMGDAFLLPIKFKRQEPEKCGIAALSAVLEYLEMPYSGIDKIYSGKEKGTKLITLVNYANQYVHTDVRRVGYEEITAHTIRGRPVIVMRKVRGRYHYYAVRGFVRNNRKIIVNDGYDENVLFEVAKNGDSSEADIGIIFDKAGEYR